MVNNMKSINSDYDLRRVFLYLSEKYAAMKKDKKQIKHKKELYLKLIKILVQIIIYRMKII